MAKKSLLLLVLACLIVSLALGAGCGGGKKSDADDEEAGTADDNTAPAISEVAATDITATSANIKWTTDKSATSQVEYGTAVDYGSTTTLVQDLTTAHAVKLNGLSSKTTYHFRVKSKDASSNEGVSEDFTLTTLAGVSGVAVADITINSAKVTWATDTTASSQVEYGPTSSYGSSSTLDSTLTKNHTVQLSGLMAGTTYHFRAKSKDASRVEAVSADSTFSTLSTIAIDMVKKMPQDVTMFEFLDIKAMRGAMDLTVLDASLQDKYGSELGNVGISLSQVDYLGDADRSHDSSLILVQGALDLGSVSNKLQALQGTKGDYNGVELWTTSNGTKATALLEGLVIEGDTAAVKACIDVIKGQTSSMYDNADVKEVASKLPSGMMVQLEKSAFNEKQFVSLVASGKSANKKDATNLALTAICKFERESTANTALSTMKLYMERDVDMSNTAVSQDGQFLRLTAEQSVESAITTPAIDMMKKIPQSVSKYFVGDLKGMRADADLKDLYTYYSDQYKSTASLAGVDSMADVDNVCFATTTGNSTLIMVEGHLDLAKVRSSTMLLLSSKGSYNGVELYTLSSVVGGGGAALLRGLIIVSPDIALVRACIDVIKGQASSLYGNFADVARKLGKGIATSLEVGTYNSTSYPGLVVSGLSVRKRDPSTLDVVGLCKFDTAASAASAAGADPFKNASQDGQFLQLNRTSSIADWIK